MSSASARPGVLARKGTLMKLLALLMLAACALGQPPTVDSVRVFHGDYGYWSRVERLPGGDYILAGFFWNGGNFESLRVARTTPELETIWQRQILSNNFRGIQDFVVTDNRVLLIGAEEVPLDSNSWTSHSVAINFTLSGDSVWVKDYNDPINYATLSSIAEDGSGGYYVLGTSAVLSNETYNYQVRLLHIDLNGDVLWERYYGGEVDEHSGKVLKLDGDSLAVTMLSNLGDSFHLALMWTNLNGDSLGGVIYGPLEDVSVAFPPGLQRSDSGFEIFWLDYGTANDTQSLAWVRTAYDGIPIDEIRMEIPRNSCQSYQRTSSGVMTVGFSNWGPADRNLVIGRATYGGFWEYVDEVAMPYWQEGYAFFPNDDDLLAVFGRTQSHPDSMVESALFYLHDNSGASYLFANPARVNFGVVPLGETEVRDAALMATFDSAVTVTRVDVPDNIAISLQTPFTIQAGETLAYQMAFRPEELRYYLDTVFVHSDAWNSVLAIQISGQAPFPVCSPSAAIIDFNWVRIGTESRRPLLIRNTGTATLQIDEIPQLIHYTIEPGGPFALPVDSIVLLTVTFRPESLEVYHEQLIILSDDPAGADTVLLAGRGVTNPNDAGEFPELLREFRVHAAYPNPFNATAVLRFELPARREVRVELFDVTGRLAQVVLRESLEAGDHEVTINGSGLASGIYFAKIAAGENRAVQKVVLLK